MSIGIKPLEWEKFSNQHGTQYRAKGIFGWLHYISNRDEDGHLFDGWRSIVGTFDTLEAAQAAAQANYEARIRSALVERKAEPIAHRSDCDFKHSPIQLCDCLSASPSPVYSRDGLEAATAKALENARTQILSAYRVWVADDIAAFPPPETQAGEVIAQIDAILAAKEQQP